jgi:hypothetical protein
LPFFVVLWKPCCGVEALIGHTQHLDVCCKPHLVIDLTFRAFLRSLNLHEVMAGLYGPSLGDRLDAGNWGDFNNFVKDLKISGVGWGRDELARIIS